MENEIIYVEDPRMIADYCRWNMEEQVMLAYICEELKELAGKGGGEIATKAKTNADIRMLIEEFNKRNLNNNTIVFDSCGGCIYDGRREDDGSLRKNVFPRATIYTKRD